MNNERLIKRKNGYVFLATEPPKNGSFNDAGARSIHITAIDIETAEIICEIYGLRLDGYLITKH